MSTVLLLFVLALLSITVVRQRLAERRLRKQLQVTTILLDAACDYGKWRSTVWFIEQIVGA